MANLQEMWSSKYGTSRGRLLKGALHQTEDLCFGISIYEIMAREMPFPNLGTDGIEQRVRAEEFPDI
jgi:hypothetical protein